VQCKQSFSYLWGNFLPLKPRLAVIIVSYNVRYFLEQALGAVKRASQGIDTETWVVDNHSVDDSVQMVREKFTDVHLIANTDNPGFSIANNQAIRVSDSEYVLLLNPDTVVEEATFTKCVAYLDANPDVGGLGARMIDGSGAFLPESKRGFPTAWVAFCKTFGLSTIFKKSPLFNRYHLGYLPEFETNEVDVLAGAFMMIRRSVLDEIGLLDETFFMYGEDIDLSYRIQKAGYKNVYFPETTIIHYKGESTKKGTLNYVKVFYEAMIIFARKHFTGSQAWWLILFLQAAIWFRAGISLAKSFVQAFSRPLIDAAGIWLGMAWLKNFWGFVYFKDPSYYKFSYLLLNVPAYICIWLVAVFMQGGYDRGSDLRAHVRGLLIGTIALAAFYGLMPLEWRSSRALIMLGSFWALIWTAGWRLVLHFAKHRNLRMGQSGRRQLIIVGHETESERARQLLFKAQVDVDIVTILSPNSAKTNDQTLDNLGEIAQIYRADEVVFCQKDVSAEAIMHWMTRLGTSYTYKILPEDSHSIIGSNSKNQSGELYVVDIEYRIQKPTQQRYKRLTDILVSLFILVFSPILVWKMGFGLFSAAWSCLIGRKTWVGYSKSDRALPRLSKSIFHTGQAWPDRQFAPDVQARLDFLYAKDYRFERDIEVVLSNLFRNLA
jgi:GT2 family glycosyltransferase